MARTGQGGFRQTGGAGSEQVEPGRLGDGGGAGGDPELAEDVGHVAVDGVFADHVGVGDLAVAHAPCHELQDFEFPPGETGRRGGNAIVVGRCRFFEGVLDGPLEEQGPNLQPRPPSRRALSRRPPRRACPGL